MRRRRWLAVLGTLFTATWLIGWACGPSSARVLVTIEGQGSVTITPPGAVCPEACDQRYSSSSTAGGVTLAATPARGWWLVRWQDDPDPVAVGGSGSPCFADGATPRDATVSLASLFASPTGDSTFQCQAVFEGGAHVPDDAPFGAAEGGDPAADVTLLQAGRTPEGAVWVVADTAAARPPPLSIYSQYATIRYYAGDVSGTPVAEVTIQHHDGVPERFFTGVAEADVTIVEDARGLQVVLDAPPPGITHVVIVCGTMLDPSATIETRTVPSDGTGAPLIETPLDPPPR